MFRSVAVLSLLLLGCGVPGPKTDDEPTLRVGASYGLSRFVPTASDSGSSAAALSLVYDRVAMHAAIEGRTGKKVHLRRLPTSPKTTQELAKSLVFETPIRTEIVGPARFLADFPSEEQARLFIGLNAGGFAVGQFRLELQSPGLIRLRRRETGAVNVIEIMEMDADEQWRRMLGHDIDVIPTAHGVDREHFRGMTSVRVIDYPVERVASLLFNVNHPDLANASVRRRILRAIDRAAIAALACGDPDCAIEPKPGNPLLARADGNEPLPKTLTIAVLASDRHLVKAGEVIRYQLQDIGIETQISPLSLQELVAQKGTTPALLLPMPAVRSEFLRRFSNRGRDAQRMNLCGYESNAFEDAIAAEKWQEAEQVITADAPGSALFRIRVIAVMDAHYCLDGGRIESLDWDWLADVRPCESEVPPP